MPLSVEFQGLGQGCPLSLPSPANALCQDLLCLPTLVFNLLGAQLEDSMMLFLNSRTWQTMALRRRIVACPLLLEPVAQPFWNR